MECYFYVISLLLQIFAVLNSVSSTSESSWSIIVGEDGTVEILDANSTPEDSNSTLAELKEQVLFYLDTTSSPGVSEQLYFEDEDVLEASNFNASNPTRFVIHGWLSSSSKPVCTEMRDAYLGNGDYNVILVDWSAISSQNYIYARSKIVAVGEYVGLMIDFLVAKGGLNVTDLIIFGHSLGAHVAGIAGRSALDNVPIIIGLDPAGPLFYIVGIYARLRSTDADFVQVIHTSAGFLGYEGSLGDVDIWVNGGSTQTGCGLDLFRICAHKRSYYYCAEAVGNAESNFVSHTCSDYSTYKKGSCSTTNSTILCGLEIDTTASGNYYVTTNSASLYAMD